MGSPGGISYHVELVLCEPKAPLTFGFAFILDFPPPYSFNKHTLGTEEATVRESTGSSPQRAHKLWENLEHAQINHQAEKRLTPKSQKKYLCCSDSFLCKGGKTGKYYWEEGGST